MHVANTVQQLIVNVSKVTTTTKLPKYIVYQIIL